MRKLTKSPMTERIRLFYPLDAVFSESNKLKVGDYSGPNTLKLNADHVVKKLHDDIGIFPFTALNFLLMMFLTP